MEPDIHRLQVALAVLAQNLRGDGIDSLKPISANFAYDMAEFAGRALRGDPDKMLDEWCEKTPRI